MDTPTATRVEARPGYRLYIEFSDGVAGEVELEERLFGPVFEPLRDEELFRQVALDEFGAPCWPNGADLAPDALHRRLELRRMRPQ
jgi:hypothetical protein